MHVLTPSKLEATFSKPVRASTPDHTVEHLIKDDKTQSLNFPKRLIHSPQRITKDTRAGAMTNMLSGIPTGPGLRSWGPG